MANTSSQSDSIPQNISRLPRDYQREDVEHIRKLMAAGEFCSLVGVGSGGKSNLLQLLTYPEVQDKYLGRDGYRYLVVYLNPHLMVDLSQEARQKLGLAWPGYELLLNHLGDSLLNSQHYQKEPLGESDLTAIRDYRDRLYNTVHFAKSQSGIRWIEAILHILFAADQNATKPWRVVFLLDEFEEYLRVLPARFFQSLRGLRDNHKGRIVYITASRKELSDLVRDKYDEESDDWSIMEGFAELFNEQVHYIHYLDMHSAKDTIKRLAQRFEAGILGEDVVFNTACGKLYRVTKGHPGLIRRSFHPMVRLLTQIGTDGVEKLNLADLCELLVADDGVRKECKGIYYSLLRDEQIMLNNVINGVKVEDESQLARDRLVNKFVLFPNDEDKCIPLLQQWMFETLRSAS